MLGRSSTYSRSPSTCHGSAATSNVPGLLELRVDALVAHERDELAQVADALRLEPLELVGEVEEPVVEPVGERRGAEAAVAAAGALGDPVGLEHDDAQRRVRLEQADRGPQPGEPAADDRDVRRDATLEGRRAGPGSPLRYQNEPPAGRRAASRARAGRTPARARGAGPSPAQCTRIRPVQRHRWCGFALRGGRPGRYSC